MNIGTNSGSQYRYGGYGQNGVNRQSGLEQTDRQQYRETQGGFRQNDFGSPPNFGSGFGEQYDGQNYAGSPGPSFGEVGGPFGRPGPGFSFGGPGGPGGPGSPRPDPQRMQAIGQLKTDLTAAGLDLKSIVQQVAEDNNGRPTPELINEAVKTAASTVQDSALQAKILQDVQTVSDLGPGPNGPGGPGGPEGLNRLGRGRRGRGPRGPRPPQDPKREQAFGQLKSDLSTAGLDLKSIVQQVAEANNGQPTPELVNEAIKTAASGVSDSDLQAKILADVQNLETLGPPPPPPPPPYNAGSNGYGQNVREESIDSSRLAALQQFPQLAEQYSNFS